LTPLATVSELEKHLQTTFSTAPEQDQATLALELSSGAVRAYCGWDISRQSETIEAYGEGSTVLTVPTLLLQGVNGVMLDGVSLALSDIVWTVKGQLYYGAGWPRFSVATLDIDHGYDVIPDLIKLVALDVAGRQVQNPEGLISATVGEVSRAWSTSSTPTASLTALHQTLLDRYRVF
jgi:hypothetical protein